MVLGRTQLLPGPSTASPQNEFQDVTGSVNQSFRELSKRLRTALLAAWTRRAGIKYRLLKLGSMVASATLPHPTVRIQEAHS
jgi:hypothetical protein